MLQLVKLQNGNTGGTRHADEGKTKQEKKEKVNCKSAINFKINLGANTTREAKTQTSNSIQSRRKGGPQRPILANVEESDGTKNKDCYFRVKVATSDSEADRFNTLEKWVCNASSDSLYMIL